MVDRKTDVFAFLFYIQFTHLCVQPSIFIFWNIKWLYVDRRIHNAKDIFSSQSKPVRKYTNTIFISL